MTALTNEQGVDPRTRSTRDSSAVWRAVEAERERMAHDLHDTIGQTLYGLSLCAQHCLTLLPPDLMHARELREALEELAHRSAEGVRDVRNAVYALAFLHVKVRGLSPALRSLAREFSRSTGIDVQLRIRGLRGRQPPEEVMNALYRVAHEALANVERHSRATAVLLTIDVTKDHVELGILDDGVGLEQRQVADWQSATHFGLKLMARCIEGLGGVFRAEPVDPRGLAIRARIPVDWHGTAL